MVVDVESLLSGDISAWRKTYTAYQIRVTTAIGYLTFFPTLVSDFAAFLAVDCALPASNRGVEMLRAVWDE